MMKILPSILSAHFAYLADEVHDVARDVDMIHVDVMDGRFVPNITMGANVVEALKRESKVAQDVHLMVEEPIHLLPDFLAAGADMISVHVEACKHVHRAIQIIKEGGAKAGVALNPATPAAVLDSILRDVDYVLIMTVDPGFGGQRFIPSMLHKIRAVARMIQEKQVPVKIEVDGGINSETLPLCLEAGAELFVAGSAIFNAEDRHAAIETLLRSAQEK
ncbi:ribulose-phosphate 3-epimerase [Sporolactobacillus terrae]|uniref:Ribulose-phosphate 3-epimerase n=2 Tax=Sporolactobacillus terrae TaxID=269673 RepID=A0ABX5Q512_9BACL|nr:ribulose-phosphate 3-epimerase [Sporolactobacillus terrae]QAA21726.1 ribulose-phosphate 3-epimerase [Sporolactobacillus terrae]QAA24698.1 ribulose-phosphate 3-epimerase [Sporolactobacillus terrae]